MRLIRRFDDGNAIVVAVVQARLPTLGLVLLAPSRTLWGYWEQGYYDLELVRGASREFLSVCIGANAATPRGFFVQAHTASMPAFRVALMAPGAQELPTRNVIDAPFPGEVFRAAAAMLPA